MAETCFGCCHHTETPLGSGFWYGCDLTPGLVKGSLDLATDDEPARCEKFDTHLSPNERIPEGQENP